MMPDYSSPSGSFARATAVSTELVHVHNWVRAELVRIRLTAILESHFQWEERRLVAALDALDTPPPAEELFGRAAAGETELPQSGN